MALRFENWSNNLMKHTMKKKYDDLGLPFPAEGAPFLLKIFLEPPYQEAAQELKDFMHAHDIPESFLDTTRTGRRGGTEDPKRIHIDLYGDQLHDQEGLLIWTKERISQEGHLWKEANEVWPGGEGSKKTLD